MRGLTAKERIDRKVFLPFVFFITLKRPEGRAPICVHLSRRRIAKVDLRLLGYKRRFCSGDHALVIRGHLKIPGPDQRPHYLVPAGIDTKR
jgi:hypothetical protein